jgi:hypothetical protein
MYQVELVWNREFDFVPHGRRWDTIQEAALYARAMEDSGDGARVKKTRIVDEDGKVVWAYGKEVA